MTSPHSFELTIPANATDHSIGPSNARVIDLPRVMAEMKDHVYLQRIRDHIQGGRESGVRATPTFYVNREIRDVSFGLSSLFDAVESALRT